MVPLTQPRKVEAGGEGGGVVRGVATVGEGVRVRLVFDNGYSRFTSKEVRYRVGVKVRQVKLDEAMEGMSEGGGEEGVGGVGAEGGMGEEGAAAANGAAEEEAAQV